ncbi:MAG: hypothetical protein J4A00_00855 [Gammaproteobacteria bacterium]|nr:hypothetical protein [Gammaproteobacteria bacterium]
MAAEDSGYRVYRQVGPDGTVIFSGDAGPGAEQIIVQEPMTYTAPKPTSATSEVVDEESEAEAGDGAETGTVYSALRVLSPQPEEAVRANNGDVRVSVSLQPVLRPDDRIQYLLDGQVVLAGGSSQVVLPNLDRGAHSIAAAVVNSRGEVLISSGVVRFFVLRHSLLHSN